MRAKFDQQLDTLNVMLIEMGALCEEAITYAVRALNENGDEMRRLTFETDSIIDEMEREIEALCLKLLLQQQPVARDLRQISAALKMISDMERIGDQAYDIAEITETIKDEENNLSKENINRMADASIKMVTKSIDSFVNKDMDLANDVINMDDIVDKMFDDIKAELINAVAADKRIGELLVDNLMIAKYLERICDHAVNIAEWVIFSITGKHVADKHIGEKEGL